MKEIEQLRSIASNLKNQLNLRKKPVTLNEAMKHESESLFVCYTIKMSKNKVDCQYDPKILEKVEKIIDDLNNDYSSLDVGNKQKEDILGELYS